ncbi:metal-dependent transcriptional regulator [Schaalia sp. lx-100]|uniref:metal-dependent transcriptional regulator n=1 Tax=Schaalia sp. lx-100 TaxID=2899081 RepID=UPI001E45B373|nr:metal-dependent transcriptional regulator [Schaalia sp. lx-100]
MPDLIDTTEMYLKTILEMEEDGVTPLRARIVDRLGHSGPTVSQTVARMERDGLLHVLGDRRLELTEQGRARAVSVLRKHRLAERLLSDFIGLDWTEVHDEACRWEHVMSEHVEQRLHTLLNSPTSDPYGNPIDGESHPAEGLSVELAVRASVPTRGRVVRIGEPIQAERSILQAFDAAGIRPGSRVEVESASADEVLVRNCEDADTLGEKAVVCIPLVLSPHMFIAVE